jgi:hypothetical protein
MRVAVVTNNIVENVIVSENLETAQAFLSKLYPDTHEHYSVLDCDVEKIAGNGCQLIDGIWEEPGSVAVLGWDAIRIRRDYLLGLSDWTQISDAPLTDEKKQEWAEYRSALRGITSSTENPKDVVFPDAPVK